MAKGSDGSSDWTENPDENTHGRRVFVVGTGADGAGALGVPGVAASRRNEDENSDSEVESGVEGNAESKSPPRLIARREFAGVNPENTVDAVEAACSGGR